MQDKQFWFVVGSQFLYGPEVLETVAARAAEMAEGLDGGALFMEDYTCEGLKKELFYNDIAWKLKNL